MIKIFYLLLGTNHQVWLEGVDIYILVEIDCTSEDFDALFSHLSSSSLVASRSTSSNGTLPPCAPRMKTKSQGSFLDSFRGTSGI